MVMEERIKGKKKSGKIKTEAVVQGSEDSGDNYYNSMVLVVFGMLISPYVSGRRHAQNSR